MRIAITGLTGFIGRHLLPQAFDQSWQIKALVRDPSRLPIHPRLTAIEGDLANTPALADLCAACDAVIHLAGAISAARPEGFFAVNVEGTRNLIAAAQQAGVRRFVHVSSLAAREPQLSPYAASKAEAEALLAAAPFSSVILRPAAVYGEGDEATLPLIKALMSRVAILPGTDENRFALIHAADVAAVCVDAITSPRTGIAELGDGQAYRWSDVAAITRDLFGRPSGLLFLPRVVAMGLGAAGDVMARLTGKPAMISRAKMKELYHPDWTTKGEAWPGVTSRPASQGLAAAIAWYQASGQIANIPRRTGTPS